jgi:hypothetical protein
MASVDSMAHCVPKNSKDLMATGYLEGQHVRYVARGRVWPYSTNHEYFV